MKLLNNILIEILTGICLFVRYYLDTDDDHYLVIHLLHMIMKMIKLK